MEPVITLEQLEADLKEVKIRLRAMLIIKRNLLDQKGIELSTRESLLENILALELLS